MSTTTFGPTGFVGTQGTPLREDQFEIVVGINGIPLPTTSSWTSMEGGDVTSESTFTRPGGLKPGLQLGGPSSRSDVTIKRQYTDILAQGGSTGTIQKLQNAAGQTRMYSSFTPIDGNGNPNGNTTTLTGVLKEVQTPNVDANNASAAFLTLVMAADLTATETVNT